MIGEVIRNLRTRMLAASENLRFEEAARLRDQLTAVEQVVQRQRVVSPLDVNQDVIAFAREDNDACVQIFFIRSGKIIGREYYVLEGTAEEEGPEIISEFVKQFYDRAAEIPPEVLLPHEVEEAQIIEQWLGSRTTSQLWRNHKRLCKPGVRHAFCLRPLCRLSHL